MIVIVGLVILIAAVIAGMAAVLGNTGSSHAPGHGFAVFGYHVRLHGHAVPVRSCRRDPSAPPAPPPPPPPPRSDRGDHRPRARGSRPGWLRLPAHRTVPRQAAAAAQPQPLAGQPAPGVPGGAASPPPRIAALNGAAAKGAAEPG